MTEDTSPENLRKFLESDDPAMRRMGLSMAKGVGVPKELHLTLLGILLWDSKERNREAAKDLVDGIGIKNISESQGWLESLDNLDVVVRWSAVRALEKIGARAVEPLIKALLGSEDEDNPRLVHEAAIEALGVIGEPAVEPLIGILGDDDCNISITDSYIDSMCNRYAAAKTLGKIGEPAVELLIGVLSDKNWQGRVSAALALGMIEDERAVEPLIKASGDDIPWVRNAAKEALKKLGHEVK